MIDSSHVCQYCSRVRIFPLRLNFTNVKLYTELLLQNGVTHTVIPRTNRIDVVTPFELSSDLFPDVKWLIP